MPYRCTVSLCGIYDPTKDLHASIPGSLAVYGRLIHVILKTILLPSHTSYIIPCFEEQERLKIMYTGQPAKNRTVQKWRPQSVGGWVGGWRGGWMRSSIKQ